MQQMQSYAPIFSVGDEDSLPRYWLVTLAFFFCAGGAYHLGRCL